MPYSSVTYTGTGITGPYAVTFPYIDRTHVKAYLNGVATTAFTWLTSSSIQFSSAVTAGVSIVLQRETPKDARLVDYADATVLLAADLDRSDDQNFFVAQELIDAGLLGSTDGTLDAGSKRIKNVANGVNSQDAVTMGQLAAAAIAPAGTLAVANGGTGGTTAAAARTNLGLGALAVKSTVSPSDLAVSAGGAPSILMSPTTGAAFAEYQLLSQSFNVTGTQIGAPRNANKRQCVVAGARDANGLPAFITTGTGLAPALVATASPLYMTFAQGYNLYGQRDNPCRITADVAGFLGSLPASQSVFATATYVDASTVTWSYTSIPDQDGETFDRTKQSLLHFEQNGAAPLDDYGMTWALNTGAVINNTKPAYGSYSLNLSGGASNTTNAKCAYTTDFTSFPADSWEVSCVVNFDVMSAAATSHYLWTAVNNSGYGALCQVYGGKLDLLLSSTGSGYDINATSGSGTTTLAINTWYRVRCVFDHLGGTYKVYLSNGGTGGTPTWTAETLEKTITSSARVCAPTRLSVGAYWSGSYSNGISGYVDEFRFLPCSTGNAVQTPSGFPLSPAAGVYWYSPAEGLMYAVTSASTAAGTNPGMTAVNLLVLAEIETGASTVSVVRCRPYNGRYRSAAFSLSSTNATFSHNMGTARVNAKLKTRLRQDRGTGLPVGTEIEMFGGYNSGTYVTTFPGVGATRRNTISTIYQLTSGYSAATPGGGSYFLNNFESYPNDSFVEVERAY